MTALLAILALATTQDFTVHWPAELYIAIDGRFTETQRQEIRLQLFRQLGIKKLFITEAKNPAVQLEFIRIPTGKFITGQAELNLTERSVIRLTDKDFSTTLIHEISRLTGKRF